jgi:hypothetical protein
VTAATIAARLRALHIVGIIDEWIGYPQNVEGGRVRNRRIVHLLQSVVVRERIGTYISGQICLELLGRIRHIDFRARHAAT